MYCCIMDSKVYEHLNFTFINVFWLKECMVDEDGRFTELAGPKLQNLSVMTEGTDTGRRSQS